MTLTPSEMFIGIGLIVGLAVACQIVAERLRLPAIVLLLPAGFIAGALTDDVNPNNIVGAAFSPLVAIAVAIILFDGGLDLKIRELEGHSQRVVRRLLMWGIPITWVAAAGFAGLLLGGSPRIAIMEGAILIVSGPTVVAPLLRLARPGERPTRILFWEGTTIDPIGAIIGALTFQAVQSGVSIRPGVEVLTFLGNVGVGVAGGAIGTGFLWLLLQRARVSSVLATEAVIATVVVVAAGCDAARDDTGLIAAITMGIAITNLSAMDAIEDRRFFKTIVELAIGVLFVSISATVTPASVRAVLWPSLVLVLCLVVVVRPVVAGLATMRTSLTREERAFIAWMHPRGIVAASTAATFAAPLVAAGLDGADHLLAATFLVIAGTVAVYGLTAVPLARVLGLAEPAPEPEIEEVAPPA